MNQRGFFRYQLADDYFYRRHDDHGRRYGKSWFFPLALHGDRKDGKISGYSDLYDVYAAVFRTGYVHRQYTVILFLAAVTIELSQLLEFDPVPMILSEIFCANLGGSATMCGDPPNIIIGTSLGYSFTDFITNTGLMAVVSLVFVVIYFYFAFRKELRKMGQIKKTILPILIRRKQS